MKHTLRISVSAVNLLAALLMLTGSAGASPLLYVVSSLQQFGTLDPGNGSFHRIGSAVLEGSSGLVPGPDGSLLTLNFSGDLGAINPATGVTSVIGPTGLANCTLPTDPCGPTSTITLGRLGGTTYATDFSHNLYSVNPATGAATLIGPTGIPAVPAIPFTTNPDGTTNLFTGTLFGAGGNLYATFDAFTIDFASFAITPVIPANLYQIDPSTAIATLIAPTSLNLTAAVHVNGTTYAFNAATNQVVTLDLTTGNTSFVSNLDPAAERIYGASPVPEPASIALTGIGIAAISLWRRRRRVESRSCGN